MSAHTRAAALLAACLCLTLLAGPARADQVTLSPIRDSTLLDDFAGDMANGSGEYFFAGHTDQIWVRRALIAFNVPGSIPAGSTVTGVALTLRMSRTQAGNESVALHRVLADWGEGTSNPTGGEGSGEVATPGDSTWVHRFYPGTFWSSPGADFVAGPSATLSVGGIGFYTWTSAQLVTDVQGWLDSPGTNFGWILIGNEATNQTTKRFDSRTNGTAANRPRLVVTYTLPPTDGACCLAGETCSVLTPTACANQAGTYQGTGTDCSPNPCTAPTGACCAGDGSCTELSATSCSGAGGTYGGNGTTCVPNLCPQPSGACCAPEGTCSETTQTGCSSAGGTFQGQGSTCAGTGCPVVLEPYVDALPVPPAAVPVSGQAGGAASYEIAVTEFAQRLHRDLPPTTVWGYAGSYPGPTIEAAVGQPVTVTWENDLRDESGDLRIEHYLPVDLCTHGPNHEGNNPRTVVHLHGGHVPAAYDGYPEDTILPGEGQTYVYPNDQLPATLWYHDHALGITRLNVYLGLAGFYLVRDAFEQSLGLPAGPYEIPLMIQDRSFRPDGSFEYPAAWDEHFFGDKILVNGVVWPYLEVVRGKYRLRVLNGSNARTLTLSLSAPGATFTQIGSDGGLLPQPVVLSQLTLAPAERADVIIDFAPYPAGTEILLQNSAPAPYPGLPGEGVVPDVMKFVVRPQSGHTAAIPASLRPLAALDEYDAVAVRDFELRKQSEPCAGSEWTINGLAWHDIVEYPELGTVEVWRFINRSGTMHPMHMHLVMFQVLDRQPFEIVEGEIVPSGPPVAPPPEESGWKDTVRVGPFEIVRLVARFEDFTGRFAYHCHVLEHEDHEMMRQFQTVQCGQGEVEPTEECDDGNPLGDDGCSSTCEIEQFLSVAGSAAGGTFSVEVDGVLVSVTTSAGQSARAVAAALAAAINADPTLSAAGVWAFADGERVVTNGKLDSVSSGDAGLIDVLVLAVSRSGLWWSQLDAAQSYDVVSGDLGALRSGGGDFSVATTTCVVANSEYKYQSDDTVPATGSGVWYLVRASGGTYDSGAPSQVAPRDAEIAASGNDCP